MTAPGCTILREDTAAVANPEAGLWGNIECAADSRHQHVLTGGDPNVRSSGTSQGNTAYRNLTVLDGDDFSGERCQLGRNERGYGENSGTQTSGTFALYNQGERKITFLSMRQGAGFDANVNAWQLGYNSKQTQPYAASSPDGNAVEMQMYGGQLRLTVFWQQLADVWVTPAPANGVWVRYALDVVYSTDPAVGKTRVYVDKNGDGDALDAGEQSPTISGQTLATDESGQPIPSHLRLGLYHNPVIPCPAPSGCQVDIDNVQVVGG